MTNPDRRDGPGEEPRHSARADLPASSGPAAPVAITGMACRFPGAKNLSAFWSLLEAGGNAVQEGVPGSGIGRVGALFPENTGQVDACRYGAYLDELDRFDAAFFRISPVEAQRLDPQQRLMLETSWLALEDAGIDADRLRGSRTGVYAGISNYDYRGLLLEADETGETEGSAANLYTVTGTSFNTAIGRVAFALGLEGPAMAVDTACSSSLVAMHQAVSGLQRGETDLALVGGVHTILSGRLLEMRANAGMLSPDGQCKTFDASANGYVRGEGCGILVLKRLDEAEAQGDRIWGVIRGSAVNQDGASPGLTVPNGAAQERVIEAALEQAGVHPLEVDYVEAHGTGTEVGDPIEFNATAAAYCRGRDSNRPLLVGSVKTNIGHLEPAAGVAGVIKTVLAMKQGLIPKHLHFHNPSPAMEWDRFALQVTAAPTPWPVQPDRPPLAGVSGFGWSGTNAHVVLAGYGAPNGASSSRPEGYWAAGSPVVVSLPPSVAERSRPGAGPAPRVKRFLPLSGKSDTAVRELARQYLAWLDEREPALASGGAAADPLLSDMAWTALAGRSHFGQRKGVAFHDVQSLRDGLSAVATAEIGRRTASKVAFAYTGQASQWPGMGAALYASEPVVRTVLDRCDALLREDRGASLLDIMFGRPGAEGDLDDPQWKQPAIYALECALTALWSSIGIKPDVVFGHSLGEIAAAHTAGVFGLEDGLRFAAARGALIGALPGDGAMAAVFAPAARVAEALDRHNAASAGVGLCIAADNGPQQVVSGPTEEIGAILERFEAENIRVARLRKSPAYHSTMIEPALDDLEAALSTVAFSPPSVTLVSNLTGQAVGAGESLDGAYWRRQAREPVAFRACIETLAELGVDAVIEIGPHAVLGPMTTLAWPEGTRAPAPAVLTSLRRPGRDEEAPGPGSGGGFVEAVVDAYEAGLPLRFDGLFAGEARRRIELPGYPFQRERYWIDPPKRRRAGAGHALLGERHDSASGEITFDTEIFLSDPAWLADHRVFGRYVAPGALYGAMAASACIAEGGGRGALEDMQLHKPLILPGPGGEEEGAEEGRRMQVVLDGSAGGAARGVRVLSKGAADEEWTLHAEGRLSPAPASGPQPTAAALDLPGLKAGMSPVDLSAYYRAKADVGIDFGPAFRTVEALWSRPGEALGEVALPEAFRGGGLELHPLLLDGCFQVVAAARAPVGDDDNSTYLPFAWERLSLPDRPLDRLICHVRLRDKPGAGEAGAEGVEAPEVASTDIALYDGQGAPVGALSGYTVKRATRSALLAAMEGVDDLLYEVVWRDRPLPPGMPAADFLTGISTVAAATGPFADYLAAEGVDAADRTALLADLELLSRSYALSTLDRLGWTRIAGDTVDPAALQQRLKVEAEHERLFRRMLEMLAASGVLTPAADGFVVAVGSDDPLPGGLPADPDGFADRIASQYPHGSNEIGLFRRCAGALAGVLRGEADPLTLLFSNSPPSVADYYRMAPAARAANRMLADAVAALIDGLPDGRRLRVLEVGAGTGSATVSVLPALPAGRFDYTYTDISAGFFAEAERRFAEDGDAIDYRVLDIEQDPAAQGFDRHGYDLLIAANVLHATRRLDETLAHCRALLAPSGQLVALENLRGQGWLDLTFGQLDGWWRFADDYRTSGALAGPDVWQRALADAGFAGAAVLGFTGSAGSARPDRGVILAQGPAEATETAGVWVLAEDRNGMAAALAAELGARNQTVVLAGGEPPPDEGAVETAPGVIRKTVDMERRESWQSLIANLPRDVPLAGVAHLVAQDGHGPEAATAEMAADTQRATASALALAQGLADADAEPVKGIWFLTRGAQVLERERDGQLAGAALWGFGKVLAREAPQLRPRMLDLDPADAASPADIVNELMYPDDETHIAFRAGRRQAARLVRTADGTKRLALPEDAAWRLAPDNSGAIDDLRAEPLSALPLEADEVRIAVEAAGLNFRDVLRTVGALDTGLLGREMCGRVAETGSGVSTVSVGDRVVGLGFGTFGPEAVTRQELVAPAPSAFSTAELATMPTAFVSAALSFDFSGLEAGERVLIHAGAGGVGLAAIQLAQTAGARIFATASAPKQAYLRSLGVEQVFDSRTTGFGREVLDATGGAGVDVVLNSLTGEGFIDASLSCLTEGGRFVELARRDILTEEEMAARRPDVAYTILDLDILKKQDPALPGAALTRIVDRLAAGELAPLPHTGWPLAEAGSAMTFMRAARHIGKIVLTASPVAAGRLRKDRTYLVTGGLGGIGCALAEWLVERDAGAVVLNGRRAPDAAAETAIDALRGRGFRVEVALADVTDTAQVDAMLADMDKTLPPLGGVIHSVGVLSDAALANQSWENFETVLWPKMLGAWHLHRATVDRDLDLFVLFSSVAGVLGNPGQANHAAANAFLDQLAGHRRALGLPGQVVSWGAWSELGEAEEQRERIARRRETSGTGWFSPEQGFKALDRLLRQDAASAVVAAVDWPVFGASLEGRPSLFEELLAIDTDEGGDSASSEENLPVQLAAIPAAGREDLLVSFLQREVQAVLRLPSAPGSTVGFFDLGMDSLMAVELRNRLNRAFSDSYAAPNTLVFDYPTIADLARHLVDALGEPAPAPEAAPDPGPRAPAARNGDGGIAIVGMACRFPGAPDIATYWHRLETGQDAVTDGRQDNGAWARVAGDPETDNGIWGRGGFVDGIDRFDARFFDMTPISARVMDPQQRLLLETSWRALEDAGIDPEGLKGSRTGVYAGIATSEYRDLMMMAGGDVLNYLGTASSMAVGGVAFKLGLAGPAMPVMLNCAASLVTVQQAVAALRDGDVDLALVGGVNAILSPGLTREMAVLGMLSRQGLCKTFDAAADGFVRSEGCGMVVLKRLDEAEAAGDRIWAVIRGAAVNQNGVSAGPTVPNGPAQERVIDEALSQAGVLPSDVDYLEAHGAGSALGDSIEVQAAASVYGRARDRDRPLLIGSVKTNIGHLESAAGIASLIKVVLAMRHGLIPKHLHFRDPNPHLDWDRLPVKVVSEATDWPRRPDGPLLAGVSAFGISGTNAHVVVEGYGSPDKASPRPEGAPQPVAVPRPEAAMGPPQTGDGFAARGTRLLPLSAKSGASLRKAAERYLAWLDEREPVLAADGAASGPVLSDMAWTAGTGRSHFDHRAAVVFADCGSLRAGLRALAEANEPSEPVTPAKVAFAYAGHGNGWIGTGEALYETEPVVRAVLDRCEEVLREARGASLLDTMFARPGSEGDLADPQWERPAAYALACALTALWSSVGVAPGVAVGDGIGTLAAAQAAGVFSLEDGLRLAASLDDPGAVLDGIAIGSPSLTLLDSASGRVVGPDEMQDGAYWRQCAASESETLENCVEALAASAVDAVVEIGSDTALGAVLPAAWPDSAGNGAAPAVLSSLGPAPGNGASPKSGSNACFVDAVAKAYEAGAALSFAGLFAGETRRRTSLPDYPFERRRHWIRLRKRPASPPG